MSDDGTWVEAVPDHLVDDIYSELGLMLGIDGNDDEATDWLTDIVSTITPYVGRVLLDLTERADMAEADLAVVVEVLRRAGAATITVPCNWRTVAVANTHGLGFVRAVDTSTDEHDVLRRLLTEEQT